MVHLELITLLRLPIEIKLSILLVGRIAIHPHVGVGLKLRENALHIVHYHREIYINKLTLSYRYLLPVLTTHLLSHILKVSQIS